MNLLKSIQIVSLVMLSAFAGGCSTPIGERPAEIAIVDADARRTQDPEAAALRTRIAELERRLTTELQARNAAESRERSLAQRVDELEGRVLTLSLERIRMEQELLRVNLDALSAEVEPGASAATLTPRDGTKAAERDTTPPRSTELLDRVKIPTQGRR